MHHQKQKDKHQHPKQQKGAPDHQKQQKKLSDVQKEIKKQCDVMSQIVTPDDKSIQFKYCSNDDETVDLSREMAFCINGTIFRQHFYDPGPKDPEKKLSEIIVSKETAISIARKVHTKDPKKNICIMSFASSKQPGGNFCQITQESSLISQTLLLGSLRSKTAIPFYNNDTKNGKSDDNGLIYSPRVPVVADGETKISFMTKPSNKGKKPPRYKLLNRNDVFFVDVASVSPVKKSKPNNRKSDTSKTDNLIEQKIRNTVYIAAMRADVLILGPFGCGSLGNEPKDICRIFKKVLFSDHYANYFEKIYFATAHSRKNYDAFCRGFNVKQADDKDDSEDEKVEEDVEEDSEGNENEKSDNEGGSENESDKDENEDE